jgi:hypothetical protein
MGAALTYVRRYALFTLVGIAGEDDLDAPELCASIPAMGALGKAGSAGAAGKLAPDRGVDRPAGGLRVPPRSHGDGRTRAATKPPSPPVLSPDQSAVLRDRLLGEIAALPSEDSAADWAQWALTAKNQLTAADARLLQVAFELRLSAFLLAESSEPSVGSRSLGRSSSASDATIGTSAGPDDAGAPLSQQGAPSLRCPTSLSPLWPQAIRPPSPAPPTAAGLGSQGKRRVRGAALPHPSSAGASGSNEAAWWKDAGIDPAMAARKLWNYTRRDERRIEPGPTPQRPSANGTAFDPQGADSPTPA